MQPVNSLLHLIFVDEGVPFGDFVIDGAAGVGGAEGGSAVHAAGGLNFAFDAVVLEVDV